MPSKPPMLTRTHIQALCLHAMAKKFKEVVFPSLPHNKGSKKLSPLGELYGEKLCAICFSHAFLWIKDISYVFFLHTKLRKSDFYMAAVPVQWSWEQEGIWAIWGFQMLTQWSEDSEGPECQVLKGVSWVTRKLAYKGWQAWKSH